jgi:hypothetical protein
MLVSSFVRNRQRLSDHSRSGVVAPFSSGDKSLTGVIRLLAEGRCALATNFAAFKYDCRCYLLLRTSICLQV